MLDSFKSQRIAEICKVGRKKIENPKLMEIWERLYRDRERADRTFSAISELRSVQQELEAKRLSKVVQNLCSSSRAPIEEHRMNGEIRKLRRRGEYERVSTPTFRPRILAESARSASACGRTHVPVTERLYRAGPVKGSGSTTESLTTTRVIGDLGAFLERQDVYSEAKSLHGSIRERMEYINCPFTPTIAARSERLVTSARGCGTASDFVRRLAIDEPQRRLAKHAESLRNRSNEFHYRPHIDSFSDAIASYKRSLDPAPVHERLYRATHATLSKTIGSGGKDTAAPADVSRPATTASSAHPRVSKRYAHVRPQYNMRDPRMMQASIDRARRDKAQRIEQHKREVLHRELEECTFQPNADRREALRDVSNSGRTRVRSPRPVPISGLDKFLDMQRKARMRDEYSRAPAFREYESPSTASGCITVPSPFTFATRPNTATYSEN